MAELILTEEEQQDVDEGEAAGFLLDHPSFLLAIERVRKDCAENILQSKPEDHVVREALYNLSRGLTAVTEELRIIEAKAVTILENARANTPDDEDEVQAEEPDQPVDY